MNKMQRWVLGSVPVIAVLGLTILVLSQSSAAAGKPAEQVPFPGPESPQVEQLWTALQNDRLSEQDRLGLQEKLAMAERMAANKAAGAQAARKEKVAPPLPAAAVASQAEPDLEGIFEGSQGLIRPSTADIENGWQGEFNGALTQVFAGSLPDHPEQGIVLVVQMDLDSLTRTVALRQAPGNTGALRIIEAQDALLVLSAGDGSRLVFDLNTLSFQD